MEFFFYEYIDKNLKIEFPTLKEMHTKNLRYMQKFDNDTPFAT